MPRIPKGTQYDADDETILAHFDESIELDGQQRENRAELSAHNKKMFVDGVDPGTMAICRRLALMKPGKRGVAVALLHRYLQVLASRLGDPVDPATKNGEARRDTIPFTGARSAA